MSDPVIAAIDAELKLVEAQRTELKLKSDAAGAVADTAFAAFNKVDARFQTLQRARLALGGQ